MVVETGEGLNDANSYVGIEFADDYFSARGVEGWEALTAEQKERSLIRATDFVDNVYQWLGKKASASQSLRFPRDNLFDYEGNAVESVPKCLKQAVCDAAFLDSSGTELFQTKNENGEVVSENITSLSFTYARNDKQETTGTTLYDAINTKLRGLFKEPNSNRVVSGKVERV